MEELFDYESIRSFIVDLDGMAQLGGSTPRDDLKQVPEPLRAVVASALSTVQAAASVPTAIGLLGVREWLSLRQQAVEHPEIGPTDAWELVARQLVYETAYWDIQEILKKCGRLLELALMPRPVTVSPRAENLFKHVGRCYVAGFEPECAIACRAVLEAEIESAVSNDDCIRVLGTRTPLRFGLDDKIAVAARLELISDKAASKAHEVRRVVNAILHRGRELEVGIDTIVRSTLEVLDELDSH